MLSLEELERYARHTSLDQIGEEGQEKLKRSSVLIVGAGGLGCPVAQYLVAAGVGKIGLIDHDLVDISNLQRQVLFGEGDVGKPKVEVAKKRLLQSNSSVTISAYHERLNQENAQQLFSEYDVIVDGVDNFQTKYLINDACILADKPMVSGAIYKFQGQLSTFNYQGGPSYRCLFPDRKAEEASCEEVGVLGVLPGIIGTMQAAEVIKIILGLGEVLSGKLKVIDTLTMQEQMVAFEKNEKEIERVKEGFLKGDEAQWINPINDALYLDVRELTEMPRIKSDRLLQIPLREVSERHDEIPKDEEVLVCCQSGKRSLQAIDILHGNFGFTNLKNLEGGVKELIQ